MSEPKKPSLTLIFSLVIVFIAMGMIGLLISLHYSLPLEYRHQLGWLDMLRAYFRGLCFEWGIFQ